MTTTVFQGHLIANRWVTTEGEEFESVSPSDDSVVWRGGSATMDVVNQATAAAQRPLGRGGINRSEARIDLVNRFAECVKKRGDELAELISREMGKPLWECKTEVAGVVGKAALSIQAFTERRSGDSFPSGDVQAVTRYKPFGVMAVLGPFNLPAHLPNGHIVPAVLAGNTVVFKPSEQTPAVGQWMMERWLEAGLPEGVINLVQGPRETAISLAADPELDGLLFTGSSAAGRALHHTFGPWPQKMLALEMSGNNPLIIHRAGDLTAAAYYTVLSAFITAGQRCTCARRLILVDGPEAESLLENLLAMLPKVRIGYWDDDPEPFLATVVSKQMGARLLGAQQALVAAGAEPLQLMTAHRNNEALLSPGVLDVTGMADRSDEEWFGPMLQVIRVKDFDAAMREANDSDFGMSASLVCDDQELYTQFIHGIRAGVVNWNRPTTGATGKLPFGGCGMSGNNRPSGYFAADYCNWPVATLEATNVQMPETTMTGIDL